MDTLENDDAFFQDYEHDFDLDGLDMFGEFEESFVQDFLSEEDQMEFLNTNDYNLNSPIILEHVTELTKFLLGHSYNPLYYRPSWDFIKKLNLKQGLGYQPQIQDLDYAHHKLFGFLLSPATGFTSTFFKILRDSLSAHSLNKEILNLFFKHWGGNNILDSHTAWDDYNRLGTKWFAWWSEIYYETHVITLHLNCSGKKEAKNLTSLYHTLQIIHDNKVLGFQLSLPILGQIIILGEYVICPRMACIWDRPFLLMIKDLTMSRTQSILSMTFSLEPRYTDAEIEKMTQVYVTGDNYLLNTGNLGYDGIKLLEPICNLKLCELARSYRPKIPEFPEFRGHVEKSVKDKSLGQHELLDIFHMVMEEPSLEMVLNFYSIFRHWGHPNIEYQEGLRKLHEQVTMDKNIDDSYAQSLASDLAYKILKKCYFEKKKWFVDKNQMSGNHKFYKHVINSTWPNQFEIEDFGDNWHLLPITKIYDIPDLVDPSLIYSDKSHSMNRTEVLNFLRTSPGKTIPTRRVLRTMLTKPATDWNRFLKRVNDEGLDMDSLIIGLKAKEREMKRIGRFFSLMSWELREYFVFTEYLIKEYFVPLFHGLTMADDLQSVIKKMLENSQGQGRNDYEYVSIANHIDYEKWNNHQRKESNCHVFRVMGQCFGLPNLFLRTHEFFEKSLIYYPQRPDLMCPSGDTLVNLTDILVSWDGQAGGLEGLRQKGWSVLNYLVIERESRIRNTRVKVLAQGDNQTISTFYHLQPSFDDQELKEQLTNITKNNKAIMQAIESGTTKLGLIINQDETMVSADYLNYGKVPIFRGVIRGLHLKRWSRVNCVTNDQVPSLSNSLASCATNALTVSHYSPDPINAMYLHNIFGNITISFLLEYDPALRTSPKKVIRDSELLDSPHFRSLLLYLDPSIGGVSGTSLTRFLIRMFPDPLTESLSFWKFIHDHSRNPLLSNLASSAGNPELMEFSIEHLDKLIENPSGINLTRGISATNLIKNEVKQNLIRSTSQISNEIIRHALEYTRDEESALLQWARTIKPLFPRFLSEMVNSTYYGITTSLIGLFQNSKTIRTQFRKRYHKRIDDVIFKSEIIGLSSLFRIIKVPTSCPQRIWSCSSTHADYLREKSWGQKILGMTIPHPLELLSKPGNMTNFCAFCSVPSAYSDYISVLVPKGFNLSGHTKGPYPPYLGSKTSESTSIIQPWEKETNIPLIKRAAKLRHAISWFINPESNLAKSILGNLVSLTGEEWNQSLEGFRRTGSALHRYSCSRVSNGGYCASSPSRFMWMICTTDTMDSLSGKNFDFMFQSLLIYSQATTSTRWGPKDSPAHLHFHIGCSSCIREIGEPILDCDWVLNLPKVSHILNAWRPDPTAKWGEVKTTLVIQKRDWQKLGPSQKSYQVGHIMGFLFTDMLLSHSKHVSDSSLFPLGISRKLIPKAWYDGLLMGIQRSCSLQIVHRRNLLELKKPRVVQWGSSYFVIEKICDSPGFLGLIRDGPLFEELLSIPHKIPSSYPLNNHDLGLLARDYMKTKLFATFEQTTVPGSEVVWSFADLQSHEILGSLGLSLKSYQMIMAIKKDKSFKDHIRLIQTSYISVKNGVWDELDMTKILDNISVCDQEVRHACKFDIGPFLTESPKNALTWGPETYADLMIIPFHYTHEPTEKPTIHFPRRFAPLVSGLRLFQMATGSHYKVRSILKQLGIKWSFALVGGDGSGGVSGYLCRSNPFGEVVFNSLLELDGIDFKGSHPSPPPAIAALGSDSVRCINLTTCWEHPSDLTRQETWDYLGKFTNTKSKQFDLIIIEADIPDPDKIRSLSTHLHTFTLTHLNPAGTLIVRSFLPHVYNEYNNLLETLGRHFISVDMYQTGYTSNFSFEVYIVFRKMFHGPPILRYIDWSSFQLGVAKSFGYGTIHTEFERSKKVGKLNHLNGVPVDLILDPQVDLSNLLVRVGLESGFAVSIAKAWKRYKAGDGVNYVLAVTALVSESIVTTTRLALHKPNPPSNSDLENLFSFIYGVRLWMALVLDSEEIFGSTVHILSTSADIYISFKPRVSSKNPKPSFETKWKFTHINSENLIHKRVRLHRKSSLIGSIIRCFVMMFGTDPCQMNREKITTILQYYNKGLSAKKIEESTDLLTL
ncbi:polymerase [La Joya virus]|uniref:Replicase n=2 Tax=La Joya virus TaxID=1272946 RepID=A0A0D3R134_9RHAB|nr:polymerase [La Joya virus]AJR28296.1 polymerase [La Joya virus]